MGIAANAVADLAGPPPPRAASAADNSPDAPSFQDRLSAADRTAPDQARAQPKSDARARPTQPQSSGPSRDQSSERSEETTARAQSGQAADTHADTKSDPVNPPIFLQLIANAIAPILAAKAAQTAPLQQQENPQPTPAEQAAAQASSAQAMSAQAAALANTAAPIKFAPKADAAARPAQIKTAKGATEKTQASATAPAIAAANGAVSASPTETAAPVTAAANLVALDGASARGEAKSNAASGAIEGVEAAPTRAGPPREPRQAARSAPSAHAPAPTPEPPLEVNAAETKSRDAGKAPSLPEALKQAARDFAPATPKAQPSLSTQAASLSAHPQLATPVEQGPASAANARTQAPPVALQVGGEIIRRFNGADTSFQLRLDPPDLGRVDVRLDVSRDHRVTAVFSADSPQALSDLARGARDLQLALQSAGLDLADDGLRFDLSSNGQGNAFAQAQAQQDQPGFRAASAAPTETSIAPELTAQRPLSIDSWRGGRVDLMA